MFRDETTEQFCHRSDPLRKKSKPQGSAFAQQKKKIVQVQRLANLKMIGPFVLILNMTWQPYTCVKYIQILLAYTPRTRVGPPSYYYILQIGDSF